MAMAFTPDTDCLLEWISVLNSVVLVKVLVKSGTSTK